MRPPPDLSLILACYNDESIVAESLDEVVATLDFSGLSYELVLVDDGSLDRTEERLRDGARRHGTHVPVRVIRHGKNRGRGAAVRTGLLEATGEVAGFLDLDLEVHVRYVPPAVLAIRRGADVVIGRRVYKFSLRSIDRVILSRGYARLVHWLLRFPERLDTESGFKFFRRETILPVLSRCREDGWFWDTEISALALAAGLKIVDLPCLYERRFDKRSSVRALRDSAAYVRKLFAFRRRLGAERNERNQS